MVVTDVEPDRLALSPASAVGPPRGLGGAKGIAMTILEELGFSFPAIF
jgi:hypothetical protein